MSIYKKYDEKIILLHNEGLNNKEISKVIGIDSRRICERLKINGLKSNYTNINKKISIDNKIQKEVLIGTIIGDGCLFKSKKNKNYRMNLSHSLKQEEYFKYKFEILKSLINSEFKYNNLFDKRNNKIYKEIKFQSKTNELFTKLYNIWYKDGKKIIPYNEIIKCDKLTLAIKYFDDGWNSKSGCYIAMCDYDEQSINNFMMWLSEKFNILPSIHRGNNLYIPSKYKIYFFSLIRKFATSDVLYKLGENRETPNK